MANYLLPLLKAIAARTKANFIEKTRQTSVVQEQFLYSLLRGYQDTELGKKYQLRQIKTLDQFRERIPVLPYSSYEPLIERIAQGEKNVLTPDPVIYLSLSSGSTGKQKLIPVTRKSQNAYQKATQVSMGFADEALRSQGRQLGKIMSVGSVQVFGRTSGGIDYGPASVGVLRLGKLLYEHIVAHPFDTLKPADMLARHYVCLLFALRERALRNMGGNYPMLVLRVCNYLEQYAEDLIHDIEQGTIASWLKLEPELRASLERRCLANPSRATQLREVLQTEGRLTPKLAWPDLSLIATARGGTSDFYFEQFPTYFGDTPTFGVAYSSSESMFGICHSLNEDSGILAIESSFFEFIPVDQWEESHPKTLLPTEVKIGEYYRILVTNYTGFYRYDVGDVVQVVGFYEQAPLIVFRYRRGGILSSTTEKTTEFHVIQVMQALQDEFGLLLDDFCITLSEPEIPAHYLVNIELASGQTLKNPQAFLERFDLKLQEIHTSYAVKRPDQVPSPRLRLLAPGSFRTLRQRQVQKGIPDFQLKLSHLSEDRNFLAGLAVEQEVRLPDDL